MNEKPPVKNKLRLLSGAVFAVTLLGGCQTLDEQNRMAHGAGAGGSVGVGQQQAEPAPSGANMFPHGRRSPALRGEAAALYEQAVAQFRRDQANPAIFSVANAIPCELSEHSQSLIAHLKTPTAFAISRKDVDVLIGSSTVYEGLRVYLLSGECKDGAVEGPFEAVVTFTYTTRYSFGVQRIEVRQRVSGVMTEGKLNGAVSVFSRVDSMVPSQERVVVDSVLKASFVDNVETGVAVNYSENQQFNSTSVSFGLSNGMRKAYSYIGNQLSTESLTYQGRAYGATLTYANAQVTSRMYFWGGRPVAGAQYENTPEDKPLVETVGLGFRLPPNISGPFRVAEVFYLAPAANAGLLPGDLVMSINGRALTASDNRHSIQAMLAEAEDGEVVLEVLRDGANSSQPIRIKRGAYKIPMPGA